MKKLSLFALALGLSVSLVSCGENNKLLRSITLSDYSETVYVGDPYTFDGKVTANFTDSTTEDVTSECAYSTIDTSRAGEQYLTVSYEYKADKVSKSAKINVIEKGTTISVTGVKLDTASKEIKVNDEFALTETVSPKDATNKNVTWRSSDTSVATVNNGLVKGIKAGTATIKVITEDGNKEASCAITVKEDAQVGEISVDEAIEIINTLPLNTPSAKEYYVRGVTSNVEQDSNGFNGGFLNKSLKFRSVKGNNIASTVDDINGKEVVIFGYLENYNGTYQIPYLPATASPTGQKYNPILTYVETGTVVEDVLPTNIYLSTSVKTLAVGETATLIANISPANATDKTVTWTTSNKNICSVTTSGNITGKAKGRAVITAKTVNNLSAVCEVQVNDGSVTPIDGDKFEIAFNKSESDGQTELKEGTISEQVTSGLSYISSFGAMSKIYKGMYGLKFGSTRTGGSLAFNLANSISELNCTGVTLSLAQYGTSSSTVNIYINDTLIKSGSSSSSTMTATLDPSVKANSVKVSTTSRAYLAGITLICEETIPIPVTAISIPSTKAVSIGNSEKLSVTYTPSNANTGKTITWTSSNTSVATVSNGEVAGVSAGTATITARTEAGLTATCTVTVSKISVTSVSLSSTSETIRPGATKQLTATVLPSNATNKEVTWTSSNTSVATVAGGLVTAKAVGTATITAKTVDGNKTATCSIKVEESTGDAWTILIYMCGADLESENSLASGDIKEILSVSNQPENVNIVIETGGSKSWHLGSSYINGATSIDASKLSRWHVANKKIVLDQTLTYASMGLSSTLQSFVEYGIKEYPADKTGVIFWNHGGAMYGCCYDEKKGDDSLTNSEMKSAFNNALKNTGSSKLEFVGYDTCLTQVQDIAEFNSNYFNYMIASEESEAGEGWDYDTWVDDLYANKPTETILKAIVDGFITDNGGASSTRSDQTLSYLDLSKMSAYKTAFESFASALKTQLSNKSVSKETFASWMDKNVKAFAVDAESSETYFCLFDVKDMLNKISSNSTYNPGSSYITNVTNAFNNLVKYSVAQKGAGNAYGLGCIYSQGANDAYYIKQAYTSSETNFTNWLSFLKSYSYLA